MSEISAQIDAEHLLSIQNYEKTYALAWQAVAGFIPACFFYVFFITTSDNNVLLKRYALFFCVAFSVVSLASLLIMLRKKKSYLVILKSETIISNKLTEEVKQSTWRVNEVSRVYSMVLPIFLRNYNRKYGKSLLLNPFYLIFMLVCLLSSIFIKYVASAMYGLNFTIYNNFVLVFRDGEHLNIALSRADDVKVFEQYIRSNAWEDKLIKKYCITPATI